MSTAAKTPDYATLRDFLSRRKQASVANPPSADSTIPKEDGREAATEGARGSENSADVKKMPPGKNVEDGAENPKSTDVGAPNSNLEQTTADENDSQVRAVKKIEGENEKLSGLDLTKDADLTAALEALHKSAEMLPALVAASVTGTKASAATVLASQDVPAAAEWNAQQQATGNLVSRYHKLGSDRGRITVAYLRGFDDTMNYLKAALDDGSLSAMAAGDGNDVGAAAPPAAPASPADAGPADAAAAMGAGAGAGADAEAGGDQQVSPDDLAAAFAEMGITPEELLQVLQQMKGHVGAAGDMPPEVKDKAAAAIAHGEKIAHDVKAHQRSGKFTFKPAADGSPSRRSRDTVKAYLSELRAAGN